ncbi:hypothetical protein LCGC14_2292920, partial [marine sediment metagenome]
MRAPCRFVTLPDFFADDIVIDATKLAVPRADLPCEHFLLHLLGGGDAILMAVRDRADEDVRVSFAGDGPRRVAEATDIPYGAKGKIWVAVMAAKGIWHRRDVAEADARRVMRLNWKAPFPAQWRVDWTRGNGLIDSWEMVTAKPA